MVVDTARVLQGQLNLRYESIQAVPAIVVTSVDLTTNVALALIAGAACN